MVGRIPPVSGILAVGIGVVVAFVAGTVSLGVGEAVGSSSPTPTEPMVGIAVG